MHTMSPQLLPIHPSEPIASFIVKDMDHLPQLIVNHYSQLETVFTVNSMKHCSPLLTMINDYKASLKSGSKPLAPDGEQM